MAQTSVRIDRSAVDVTENSLVQGPRHRNFIHMWIEKSKRNVVNNRPSSEYQIHIYMSAHGLYLRPSPRRDYRIGYSILDY